MRSSSPHASGLLDGSDRPTPEHHRMFMRKIAVIGLTGDVVVALVILVLAPWEQPILGLVVIILVLSGVAMAIVFSVLIPRVYEKNYRSPPLP
jgi:Na+/glutamate symporter